jgi:type IV secretion system protein VirB3
MAEAIYKGATRPAMKLGIPLVPLVVLFGGGMLLIMWGGTLLSWWVARGSAAGLRARPCCWMRWVTSKDDQRFRQMFVAIKLRLHDRNRSALAGAQLQRPTSTGERAMLGMSRVAAARRCAGTARSGPAAARRPLLGAGARREPDGAPSCRSRRWSARTT